MILNAIQTIPIVYLKIKNSTNLLYNSYKNHCVCQRIIPNLSQTPFHKRTNDHFDFISKSLTAMSRATHVHLLSLTAMSWATHFDPLRSSFAPPCMGGIIGGQRARLCGRRRPPPPARANTCSSKVEVCGPRQQIEEHD